MFSTPATSDRSVETHEVDSPSSVDSAHFLDPEDWPLPDCPAEDEAAASVLLELSKNEERKFLCIAEMFHEYPVEKSNKRKRDDDDDDDEIEQPASKRVKIDQANATPSGPTLFISKDAVLKAARINTPAGRRTKVKPVNSILRITKERRALAQANDNIPEANRTKTTPAMKKARKNNNKVEVKKAKNGGK